MKYYQIQSRCKKRQKSQSEGYLNTTPLAEQCPQVEKLRWERGPEIRWRHPQEHAWGRCMLGIVEIGPLEVIYDYEGK